MIIELRFCQRLTFSSGSHCYLRSHMSGDTLQGSAKSHDIGWQMCTNYAVLSVPPNVLDAEQNHPRLSLFGTSYNSSQLAVTGGSSFCLRGEGGWLAPPQKYPRRKKGLLMFVMFGAGRGPSTGQPWGYRPGILAAEVVSMYSFFD